MYFQHAPPINLEYQIRTRVVSVERRLLGFLAAHIPLGVLMQQSSVIATLHVLMTIVIGLRWTRAGRNLERTAYLGAYITGAEVLWRMTSAKTLWESGKYITAGFFILAMLRRHQLKGPGLPLLYFVLLLPSTALSFMDLEFARARDQMSFNLSGPFALLICSWLFAKLKLTRERLLLLFAAMLAPSLSVACVTLFTTATTANIEFTGESNFATSGGFGPNQVSSLLGLGALLCILCALDNRTGRWVRGAMFGGVVFFMAQSLLTFSRGGLYNAVGALLLALPFLAKDRRLRNRLVVSTLVILVVGNFLVLPRLDAFTGGALLARFSDTTPTHRDIIIQADMNIWQENPLFGVGPGNAPQHRGREFAGIAAHTEFSRLFSEHGTFGFLALLLLIVAGWRNLRRATTPKGKAVVAAMLGWVVLYMFNAGMRTVAPSFLFGLTFATFLPDDVDEKELLAAEQRPANNGWQGNNGWQQEMPQEIRRDY